MDLNKNFDLFSKNLDKEISSLAMLANQDDIFCLSKAFESSESSGQISLSIKFYEDKIVLYFTKQLPNSQNQQGL